MENASKALIMASTVLLGIMIISIGVALYNTFSSFSKDVTQKVEDNKIAEWNNNYLKYYGKITVEKNGKEEVKPIPVTAHDIVTVANLAKQNNENYELENESGANENTFYVQVKVLGEKDGGNLEKWNDKQKNSFLQGNSVEIKEKEANVKYYYVCKEPIISSVTKRVIYIEFDEYKE